MTPVEVTRGGGPLVLSMPHGGTAIPEDLAADFNALGRSVPDTDWWIDRLYDFSGDLDATVVRATISRYVIDLNRDPSGQSLYPGQATTGLCPVETFDGEPIYRAGQEPGPAAIEARRAAWFDPYHEALGAELARLQDRHGYALLYDCHSIRSVVPRLFEGGLPVVNLGTNSGKSCAAGLARAVRQVCAAQTVFSHVVDGRFKGGWITRHYGRPAESVHALQVELAQCAYMDETPPWTFHDDKAARLRGLLRPMLETMIIWAEINLAGGNLRKKP